MQIMSARISRARLLRRYGEVEATVTLLIKADSQPFPYVAKIVTSSPARAPGAAPLRERLLASAKLKHAVERARPSQSSWAA